MKTSLKKIRPLILGFPAKSYKINSQYVKINPSVIIDPSSSINIFDYPPKARICLEIQEGSHIFSTFNILRSNSKIKIGENCQLGSSNFICVDSIEVGNDVIIAWGVTIIDSDNHSQLWEERQFDVQRGREDYIGTEGKDIARSHDWSKVKTEKIQIEDKTWIGFNSIILKGVTIGEGSVVGAGSVVTRDVEPWTLNAGNPAKFIRRLK